jgi:hypothetical protein
MKADNILQSLKENVRRSIHHGEFLLSVNKFSDYWIYLQDLWMDNTSEELIQSVLRIALQNLSLEYGSFAVPLLKIPHSGTSEEELPLSPIVGEAVRKLNSKEIQAHNIYMKAPISGGLLPTRYICVFALSVHLDLINEVVEYLKEQGRDVLAIVAVIEREGVSRDKITTELGIELIPLIVVDKENGIPRTILEVTSLPYRNMHKYFQDPVKK